MVQNMRENIQQAKQAQHTPVTVHYFHCDHLGTPIALTDQEGNIAWAARHDPWGNIEEEYNPQGMEQNIRMPGQYLDRETGLYYNLHRYYDPRIGAYINQDPIGMAGGSNFYQYALNSPVNAIDPQGLFFQMIVGAITGTFATYGVSSTYANLKSAAILKESATQEFDTAKKLQAAVLDCTTHPSSHLGCSNTELLHEMQKGYDDLFEEARKNLQKAACLIGSNTPGTSVAGDVPTSLYDLVANGVLGFFLPDPCQ